MHKIAIASAFGRAAQYYDQFARFQRLSGGCLLSLLAQQRFRRVLDAGCGTGNFSRYWREQGAEVTALDLSSPMLQIAQQQQVAQYYCCGDMEQLPLSSGQFDLCWSNLALQWCDDLTLALRELYRVTAARGWLAFTTLSRGSLAELHLAWRAVDSRLHGNLYPDMSAIMRSGPAPGIHWHRQTVTLYYPNVISAMRSVKGIGATYLHAGRVNTTLTRRQLQQLTLAWPQTANGFGLTYQLVAGVVQHD